MKLTKVERWILSNQYEILEKLDSKNKGHYSKCREILENGYELLYSEISQNIYDDKDTLNSDGAKYVYKILDMFYALGRFYKSSKSKNKFKKSDLAFMGFDGNDSTEVKYLAFARFNREYNGTSSEVIDESDGFNSHMPTSDIYYRMLSAWQISKDKYNLTTEDVERILASKTHPSNR